MPLRILIARKIAAANLIQVLSVMNKSRIAINTGRIILLLSPEAHLSAFTGRQAWCQVLLNHPVMLKPQFKGVQPIDVFIVPEERWSDGFAAPVM